MGANQSTKEKRGRAQSSKPPSRATSATDDEPMASVAGGRMDPQPPRPRGVPAHEHAYDAHAQRTGLERESLTSPAARAPTGKPPEGRN